MQFHSSSLMTALASMPVGVWQGWPEVQEMLFSVALRAPLRYHVTLAVMVVPVAVHSQRRESLVEAPVGVICGPVVNVAREERERMSAARMRVVRSRSVPWRGFVFVECVGPAGKGGGR